MDVLYTGLEFLISPLAIYQATSCPFPVPDYDNKMCIAGVLYVIFELSSMNILVHAIITIVFNALLC